MNINDLTYKVIGSAYKVHNTLGPGFLERVYENSLKLELQKLGIYARQHVRLPVYYEEQQVGLYFPDLWIEEQLHEVLINWIADFNVSADIFTICFIAARQHAFRGKFERAAE